jgi:two-component system cell cycle response regulator
MKHASFAHGGPATVLIVDDSQSIQGILREIMNGQGYQTFVASSGDEGLKAASRLLPDLILLDVVMPGLDGFETCRRLKANPATARIPVIFMSAASDTEAIVIGLDLGAVDYITKPLRMAEVCARVRVQLHIHSVNETQQDQSDRLRAIVDGMAEGLMIVEPDGRIQYANPACDSYLGYEAGALAGHTITELLSATVARDYLDYFASCLAGSPLSQQPGAREVMIRHQDGAVRAVDLTLTPMNEREPLFIGLLHDIAHHKRSETALLHAALVDPLTRIANRRHFDSFLEKEWQRAIRSGTPLSLIVLDVDHFKLYNDNLGHAAGDLCLQKVASAIEKYALRATDLAARYGGEEFVLLFAETEADSASTLAEAIRRHIEQLQIPHPCSENSQWVTASIGVATLIPNQLDPIEKLFVAADRAMYQAKDAGRNRVQAVLCGSASWDTGKTTPR